MVRIVEGFDSKLIDDYSSINLDDYRFINLDNLSDNAYGNDDEKIELVTNKSLGDDRKYFYDCTTVNEVEHFNFHSDYWGDAYDYKDAAIWIMEEILPYIDKQTVVYYEGKRYICTILALLIDRQYNGRVNVLVDNNVISLDESKTAHSYRKLRIDD